MDLCRGYSQPSNRPSSETQTYVLDSEYTRKERTMTDFCQPIRQEIAQLEQDGETGTPLTNARNRLSLCEAVDRDLTGAWGSAIAFYYIRQIGTEVFWVGFNTSQDPSQFGQWFTHVFKGSRNIDPVTGVDTVTGEWADVPFGRNRQNGTLTMVRTAYDTFTKQSETGGFGPSTWERAFGPAWPN
jgi:hypothetical protein